MHLCFCSARLSHDYDTGLSESLWEVGFWKLAVATAARILASGGLHAFGNPIGNRSLIPGASDYKMVRVWRCDAGECVQKKYIGTPATLLYSNLIIRSYLLMLAQLLYKSSRQ